jgi:isopentenyl diphosphate isomerase/L-lactate dehydrogenase-like FMN-dependent dehydrogenase
VRKLDEFLNLDDFEPAARENMEPGAFDYYAGGAADEYTVAENRAGLTVGIARRDAANDCDESPDEREGRGSWASRPSV